MTEITSAAATSIHSSVLERALEHRFLGDLSAHLWCSGIHDFAISRSEVDHYGYDVIVEVDRIIRHLQLKSKASTSATARTSVSLKLAEKPSGCVIWMVYDPQTLQLGPYLWFGGLPGDALPTLGDKVTRHSAGMPRA
jgi:hypothetical protein